MTVGPLPIVGDFHDEHVQAARDVLATDAPWWLLAGCELRFTALDRRTLGGVIRGNTAEVWGRYIGGTHRGTTRWAVAHELGHLIDKRTFRPVHGEHRAQLRADIHAAFHGFDGHDHFTTERPTPDGMHGWGAAGVEHHEAPSEAFAEWFAWRQGFNGATSYGPHTWSTRGQQEAIEEVVMGQVEQVPPFADADDISEAHAEAVKRLAGYGIFTGDGQGRANPKANVTREQMASFLVRTIDHVEANR